MSFLTSMQGMLNWCEVPTHLTCNCSLQEEWDRGIVGFVLCLLGGRNEISYLTPLTLTAGCPTCLTAAKTETRPSASVCWAVGGDTSVWRALGGASFLASPCNMLSQSVAGWVCLSLAYPSPKCLGCCERCRAHPDSRGGELFLAK